jgi:hypothetical protein
MEMDIATFSLVLLGAVSAEGGEPFLLSFACDIERAFPMRLRKLFGAAGSADILGS